MKMILRADDFGFSEAVNYGVMKAVRSGLIKNVGLMSNMPGARQACSLIKEHDICLGLHVNLIVGSPCADPENVASLLDEHGELLSSKVRRAQLKEGIDGFVYDDTRREVEAQIEQYIQLCGKLPDYIDAHAVCTSTAEQAISDAAEAYGIRVQGHRSDPRWDSIQTDYTNGEFYDLHLPYVEFFRSYLQYSDTISLIVFHPGYIDEEVLRRSSLTVNRCHDVALLCDQQVAEFLSSHTLFSFKEL